MLERMKDERENMRVEAAGMLPLIESYGRAAGDGFLDKRVPPPPPAAAGRLTLNT